MAPVVRSTVDRLDRPSAYYNNKVGLSAHVIPTLQLLTLTRTSADATAMRRMKLPRRLK
jgi:hypothetical protein